jgi:hypothetical protein
MSSVLSQRVRTHQVREDGADLLTEIAFILRMLAGNSQALHLHRQKILNGILSTSLGESLPIGHTCSKSCGSGFIVSRSGSSISNESGHGYGSRSNLDPGFWWPKLYEKNTAELFFSSFIDQKLQFTYPLLSSIKDIQATGAAFSPQKRTSNEMKFINLFLFLWVIFALLDPDLNKDPVAPLNPDPQHCM